VQGKNEGKYFKTKYRPAGILGKVNSTIYSKFKLQLKLRNHKHYSTVAVNFHTRLIRKYINLKLETGKNKSYNEKRTAH
jgi:hypothetical protein